MRVIAEYTGSERLRKFLEIGADRKHLHFSCFEITEQDVEAGPISTQTRPDWPRGLNQLGNTCYLNSLLQYFYTIKELREGIAPLAVEDTYPDVDKFKDDDLKNHRVGGRMVSRHEVVRSRRCKSVFKCRMKTISNPF